MDISNGTGVGNTFAPLDSTLLLSHCLNSQRFAPSHLVMKRYEKLPHLRKSHCPSAADIVSYWTTPCSIPDISGLDSCAIRFRGILDPHFAQPSPPAQCVFAHLPRVIRAIFINRQHNSLPRSSRAKPQDKFFGSLVNKPRTPLHSMASFATPVFRISPSLFRAQFLRYAACKPAKPFPAPRMAKVSSAFFQSSRVTMNYA